MRIQVLYKNDREEEIELEGKESIQPKLQELAGSDQIFAINIIELGKAAKAFGQMLEANKKIEHLSVFEADDELFGQVCKVIQKTPWLKTFILERGKISVDSLTALETVLTSLQSLESLTLENHHTTDEIDISPLNRVIKNCTSLKSLNIDLGKLEQTAAGDLYQAAVVEGNVASFKLVSCNADIPAVSGVTPKITDDGLVALNLSGSQLGPEYARNLSKALLAHITIKHLALRCNNIGVAGADAVAQLIEGNSSLRSIDICGNDIGKGAVKIGAALAKSKLYRIDLSNNGIDDAGIISIAEAINSGATTASIILDGNMDITQRGVDALYEAMSNFSAEHQTKVTLYNANGAWYLQCAKSGNKDFSRNPKDHDMKLDKVSNIREICEANKLNIQSELLFADIETPDMKGVDFANLFYQLAAELRSYIAAGMSVNDLPEMLSTEQGWNEEAHRKAFAGDHGAVFEVAE